MEINANWTDFKAAADAKNISIQYIDTGSRYYLYLVDGPFALTCTLLKTDSDATDFEDNYKSNGNQSLVPRDSDGSPLQRGKTTKTGWHYQPHWVEITTSKIGGIYNKDDNGVDLGFATIKLYDDIDSASATEITVQATADTDCVKTVVDWMPTHDYEVIAAKIFQDGKPSNDHRVYVVAVPDLTPAQGGSIPFSTGGINLKHLGTGAAADTDGRSSKYMTYDATYKTNKFRIIINHPAGEQHTFAMLFELFMA